MISQSDYSYAQARIYVQAVWSVIRWVGDERFSHTGDAHEWMGVLTEH